MLIQGYSVAPENAPPRVLHVITPSRMAGAETFLARLLRRSDPALVTQHCIASRSAAIAEMRMADMTFETLGISGKLNLLAMPRIHQAARDFHADLLHTHLSTASWWCGWLEKFGGPPTIGHVHGFTSSLWHSNQSHLIACSQAVKSDMIEKGIDGNRITVMNYPVDPNDQRPKRTRAAVRAEFGVDEDTPVVGTFAHLSVKKGYRELIRAAELVLNHIPKAQFWIFGEGPLRTELEDHARAAGIGDRFRLHGFRRDVPDMMRAVDVMCLPSHREPFGLVYVEAALAETPIIACDAGGAPEIIEHGESGLLIRPQNVPDLTQAILTLLDNRTHAAKLARRAHEQALNRYTWPRYLASLRNVYHQVLGRDLIDVPAADRKAA
jgi:glycosyltransferase involved in cell wall biosynthesis